LQGAVQDVNTARRTIDIDPGLARSSVTVPFDANTYVEYKGHRYNPEELERGDEVEVDVREVERGQLLAEGIHVVQNVSSGSHRTTPSTVLTVRGFAIRQQSFGEDYISVKTSIQKRLTSFTSLVYRDGEGNIGKTRAGK
jgi:hypothetical protein